MKNILILLALIYQGLFTSTTTNAQQADLLVIKNIPGSEKLSPLPLQMDSITNKDVCPGLYPAVVYRYQNNMVNFAGMGTAYQTGRTNWSIILPEHLFLKESKFTGAFAVRLARPDTGAIGFIDSIETAPDTQHAKDIVLGTIRLGMDPVTITNFSDVASKSSVYIEMSTSPVIEGKEIRTLRSLITGQGALIIGYGIEARESEKGAYPYIAVETKFTEGSSGSAYIDQDGRIFIIHGGLVAGSLIMNEVNLYFMEKYGRPVHGVGLLTGPILLEKE